MTTVQLNEIADIVISSVDKKTNTNEQVVRLCNFVDVYHNWAITNALHDDFMGATARPAQIEKFKLKKGQVAITKDSETRDDIGVSTYIADDFDDVVLGYHCALITPDESVLNGKYLNALLHTSYAQKYFANNAAGSGQRYALSVDAITSMPIPLVPIEEQNRIGNIFSMLDKKICLNRQINRNLEALAKQLYDYWFVQFDFPDENGRPYKSSDGKVVWNEKLKRQIPVGWSVTAVNEIAKSQRGVSYGKGDVTDTGVQVLRGNNIEDNHYIEDSNVVFVPSDFVAEEQKIEAFDIIMTMSSGSKEHVGKCMQFQKSSPHTFGAFLNRFRPLRHPHYLFLFLTSEYFKQKVKSVCSGTGINNLTYLHFDEIMLLEDTTIAPMFSNIVAPVFEQIGTNEKEIHDLSKLRDELLPLLMNGQVSINSDLSVCSD